jgi:hypothetical protein
MPSRPILLFLGWGEIASEPELGDYLLAVASVGLRRAFIIDRNFAVIWYECFWKG